MACEIELPESGDLYLLDIQPEEDDEISLPNLPAPMNNLTTDCDFPHQVKSQGIGGRASTVASACAAPLLYRRRRKSSLPTSLLLWLACLKQSQVAFCVRWTPWSEGRLPDVSFGHRKLGQTTVLHCFLEAYKPTCLPRCFPNLGRSLYVYILAWLCKL